MVQRSDVLLGIGALVVPAFVAFLTTSFQMSTEARRFEIDQMRLKQEYNIEAVKVALAILGGQIDQDATKTEQSRAFAIEILKRAYPETKNVNWDAWAKDGTVPTIPNLYPQSPIVSKGATEDYINSPELKAAIKTAVTEAITYAIHNQGGPVGGEAWPEPPLIQKPPIPAYPKLGKDVSPYQTMPWKGAPALPFTKDGGVMTAPKYLDNKN